MNFNGTAFARLAGMVLAIVVFVVVSMPLMGDANDGRFMLRDGSRPMEGNLSLGGHDIANLDTITATTATFTTATVSGSTIVRSTTLTVCASDAAETGQCDYVATGTGDQAKVNAAINALGVAGGAVRLSEGTFSLSGPIRVKSYVELTIPTGTTLTLANGTNNDVIENYEPSGGNTRIYIGGGGRINGNRTNQTCTVGVHSCNGVLFVKVTHSTIKDLYVDAVGHVGVAVQNGSDNVVVDHVTGTNNGYELVEFWGGTGGVTNSKILNSHAYANGQHGFLVNKNVSDILIANNTATGNGTLHNGHGFAVHAAGADTRRITLTGNTSTLNAWDGFSVDAGGTGGVDIVTFTNNIASQNNLHGFAFENGATNTAGSANTAILNQGHGFYFEEGSSYAVWTGNFAINNNEVNAAGVSGFRIEGDTTACTYIKLAGNHAYETRAGAARRQAYGINETGTNAGNSFTGNILYNNVSGQMQAYSGTMVRDNTGHVTEARGAATIPNADTSVVVTHGLSVTPVAGNCMVTAAEDPTNSPGAIYIDTYTSTQFTIHSENDPGASNLDVVWSCAVH